MPPSEDASHGGRISPGAAWHMGGSTLLWGGAACTLLLLQYSSGSWAIGALEVSVPGLPVNAFPRGVYPKKAQRWPSVYGVCRNRVEADFRLPPACVVTVLCPTVKGVMKAPCDPSIRAPAC